MFWVYEYMGQVRAYHPYSNCPSVCSPVKFIKNKRNILYIICEYDDAAADDGIGGNDHSKSDLVEWSRRHIDEDRE